MNLSEKLIKDINELDNSNRLTLAQLIMSTKDFQDTQKPNGTKGREDRMLQAPSVPLTAGEVTGAAGTNTLTLRSESKGQDSGDVWQQHIVGYGVYYSTKRDDEFYVPVKVGQGKVMYAKPIVFDETKVAVRCSCPDFRFTFAWYDKEVGSLAYGALKQYVRKTTYMPERNPLHVVGLCKHLLALTLEGQKVKVII